MTFVLFLSFFFKFVWFLFLVFFYLNMAPFLPSVGHEHMRGAGRVWLPEDLNAKLCFLWLS